jgi:hypothetical protein
VSIHGLFGYVLCRIELHFDDEYLHLTGTPYVTLRQNENGRIEGEYRIGVQSGTLIGHAYSDFMDFTFEGNDEMEEAFGEGEATLPRVGAFAHSFLWSVQRLSAADFRLSGFADYRSLSQRTEWFEAVRAFLKKGLGRARL